MKIPGTKILINQIDKEVVSSHHIEKIYYIKTHNKTIEVAQLKHQRQINQVQSTEETQSDPTDIDNTENSKLLLTRINCESTDDESETENMLSINKLKIENEYKTPIESNYYQNNNHNFENSDNTPKDKI